jgi:hypothetical protein
VKRFVVDTNVAIVANGRPEPGQQRPPSIDCRLRAVERLRELNEKGIILLDVDGAIQEEYRRHLNPRGQPGVGDRFYQIVLQSPPEIVERVELPKRSGEYVDCPSALIAEGFDPSDRKFAAMARRGRATVLNATDSDWIGHAATLRRERITVDNICGCDMDAWFDE